MRRNIIIVMLITIIAVFSISCSDSTSTSTDSGFIANPDTLSSPAPAPVCSATLTAYSRVFGSASTRRSVLIQTASQTGFGFGAYDANGRELAKLSCYVNTGSTANVLPASGSHTFTDTSGTMVIKYADDASNSKGKALHYVKNTGAVSFTVSYVSTDTYTVTVNSLPNANVSLSGTLDNVVKTQ